MEWTPLGSPESPPRIERAEIDLINGVRGLTVTGRGNGRSQLGDGLDGRGSERGRVRRGRTAWRGRGGRDGSGIGKETGGRAAGGGGGRGRGRGGWDGTRGRGASSRGGMGRRKGKAVWRKKPEPRDWAGMSWDALSVIFEKIGAVKILTSVQAVCRQWWLLAHDPRIWRIVDLRNADSYLHPDGDVSEMAIAAVDRSAGLLEEFSIGEIADNDLLLHMCGRADRLRCLRLISCEDITSNALADAIKHFPLLEELEISFCYIDKPTIAILGQSCPSLRCFRLNKHGAGLLGGEEDNNGEALIIANNMPKLRELQLLGNQIGNAGVVTILDCCPLLESLDLRCCWNLVPDNDLKKRFEKIKNLKLPGETLLGHSYYNQIDDIGDFDYDDCFGFGYDEYDDYDIYGLDDYYPELQYGDYSGFDRDPFSGDELGLLIALGTLNNAMADSIVDESD